MIPLNEFASKVSMSGIVAELEQTHYNIDDGNVGMAYPQGRGIPKWLGPCGREAVAEIEAYVGLPATYVMINKMMSNQTSPLHTDTLDTPLQGLGARIHRYHLAVTTNNFCAWYDDHNLAVAVPLGHWVGPLPYWTTHQVYNQGNTPRIHLIVDLDCKEPIS